MINIFICNFIEQKYATSFQRSKQYVEGLRAEVKEAVFKDSINNHTTPSYVFSEIDDVTYSPKHPLISKGLLAANKVWSVLVCETDTIEGII